MNKNFKKVLCAISVVTLMSGCASLVPSEKVLSRSDNVSSTPKWASFAEASFVDETNVKFIGTHEMPGDRRVSTGCKIAANKAKGEIASEIEQKLSFVFQHAEEGSELDLEQTKYIGGEASKLVASAIHYDGCYWERVAIPDGVGSYDIRFRSFAKVSIPQKSLQEAIRKASGGKLSVEFSKQVTDHWNDLTGTTPEAKE